MRVSCVCHAQDGEVPSYSTATPPVGDTKSTSKRNYGFFNAVGHSPLVASYMDRHGLKCQIGGESQPYSWLELASHVMASHVM